MTARLRRSTSMILLVALQLSMAASGFQIIHPQISANNGLLLNIPQQLPRNTAFSRSTTTSTLSAGATPQEEQAVTEFKMITEEESQLRKTGGIILAIITIVAFFTQGQNYANLCSGAFAALGTYRSGAEYQ